MKKRAILIILDGVGAGAMEDSSLYGDEGSNSLGNTALALDGLVLPNLQALGLGHITPIKGVAVVPFPQGAYGRMQELSRGKDSTTGHWEMMGVVLDKPFPTYPQGFPAGIIEEFEKRTGCKTLGNVVASGTTIIEQLGSEHVRTCCPIVYTSADSVFQIAAHEDVIPPERLYHMCQVARDILAGEHEVGRVIARPFVGEPGNYQRTSNRHDFSVEPPHNLLDCLIAAGKKVIGIGKIYDLFAGRGLSRSIPTRNNQEALQILLDTIKDGEGDFIFINLLDFDQIFGHRNDAEGYAAALHEFDKALPVLMKNLREGDLLFISSDHGNDPTTPSTDHSREYVPLLVYGRDCKAGVDLGTRNSFSDLGQTIAEYLQIPADGLAGESFYQLIKEEKHELL